MSGPLYSEVSVVLLRKNRGDFLSLNRGEDCYAGVFIIDQNHCYLKSQLLEADKREDNG